MGTEYDGRSEATLADSLNRIGGQNENKIEPISVNTDE